MFKRLIIIAFILFFSLPAMAEEKAGNSYADVSDPSDTAELILYGPNSTVNLPWSVMRAMFNAKQNKTDAMLMAVNAESAGDNCENGGTRLDIGTDSDADGTLDSDEIDTTRYVCDSAGNIASVNGYTGTVVLSASDLGLGNVNNTADADKPVSTAQQTALDAKADAATVTAHTSSTSNPHSVTAAQTAFDNATAALPENPVTTQSAVEAIVTKFGTYSLLTHDHDSDYASLTGATFTGAVSGPSFTSTAADGYHKANIYNSISFAGTPSTGDIQLDSTFGLVYWDGDSWEDPSNAGGSSTDDQTAAEVNITDSGAYYDGSTVEAALQEVGADIAGLSSGAAPTIQSADPTSSSSIGWYLATTSGDAFYKSAAGLFNISAGTYTLDPSIPTLSSLALGTNGTTLTLVFSEAVTQGSGYADSQLDLDASVTGNDIGLTYVSGDGTDTHVYTAASTINPGETVDLDFDGTADSLESSTGGDLAAIVSASVFNGSEQGGSAGFVGSSATPTSNATGGGSGAVVATYTANTSGTISYAHIYVAEAASSNFNIAIYSSDGQTKLAESDLTLVNNGAWTTLTLDTPITITASTDYVIALGSSNDTYWQVGRTSGSGTFYYGQTYITADIMPSTVNPTGGTSNASLWSVYMDNTP